MALQAAEKVESQGRGNFTLAREMNRARGGPGLFN